MNQMKTKKFILAIMAILLVTTGIFAQAEQVVNLDWLNGRYEELLAALTFLSGFVIKNFKISEKWQQRIPLVLQIAAFGIVLTLGLMATGWKPDWRVLISFLVATGLFEYVKGILAAFGNFGVTLGSLLENLFSVGRTNAMKRTSSFMRGCNNQEIREILVQGR